MPRPFDVVPPQKAHDAVQGAAHTVELPVIDLLTFDHLPDQAQIPDLPDVPAAPSLPSLDLNLPDVAPDDIPAAEVLDFLFDEI
jgi:hypothetical protein